MIPRVVVFEGPDGSGKSTLIESLRTPRTRVYHHGPYRGEVKIWRHYCETMVVNDGHDGTDEVFLDRCWVSEEPYGQVFRGGENRVTAYQRDILEGILRDHGGVVVCCLPPFRACHESFVRRHDEEWKGTGFSRESIEVDLFNLRQVWNWYLRWDGWDVLYDWTASLNVPYVELRRRIIPQKVRLL